MPIEMILEVMVAVLLVVTVVYCAMLDRRLKALRSGQDGLKAIIQGLDGATRRAQASIGELRAAGEATGLALSAHTTKGRALSDELQIMIEAGNALADRLEGSRAGAAGRAPPPRQAPPAPKPQAPRAKIPEDWEDNLMKALREAR
jgi:Domain of unknown function (DUF6468)